MTLNIHPIHTEELDRCGQKCRWKGWLGKTSHGILWPIRIFVFSRKSFKSIWSPFFGYFVRNWLFCMESYLAQNAKKKISRITLAGEPACGSPCSSIISKDSKNPTFTKLQIYRVLFLTCWSCRSCTSLKARWWTGILQNSMRYCKYIPRI